MTIKVTKGKKPEYSKRLVSDIRSLLWVVTVGGLLLAAYCIHKGYTGSLPLAVCHGGPTLDSARRCVLVLSEYGQVGSPRRRRDLRERKGSQLRAAGRK